MCTVICLRVYQNATTKRLEKTKSFILQQLLNCGETNKRQELQEGGVCAHTSHTRGCKSKGLQPATAPLSTNFSSVNTYVAVTLLQEIFLSQDQTTSPLLTPEAPILGDKHQTAEIHKHRGRHLPYSERTHVSWRESLHLS